jgi:hypothetical protein
MVVIVLGVAVGVLAVAIPVGTIWVLGHAEEVGERLVALGRRCRLLPRSPPVLTYDPPIERIAADLRRLSTAIGQLRDGAPVIRRQALLLAYDEKLAAACQALGVSHSLGELPAGVDHELEKIRVEAALEEAGLRFRSAIS